MCIVCSSALPISMLTSTHPSSYRVFLSISSPPPSSSPFPGVRVPTRLTSTSRSTFANQSAEIQSTTAAAAASFSLSLSLLPNFVSPVILGPIFTLLSSFLPSAGGAAGRLKTRHSRDGPRTISAQTPPLPAPPQCWFVTVSC